MRKRILIAAALLAAACGKDAPPVDEVGAVAAGKAIERKATQGPLAATVTVQPERPRVGDVVRLTLAVEVEAGVEVTMPPFGEALGRFDVVGFVPREEARAGGAGRRLIQEYRLQASRSGRLRIPPLRVEYVDPRTSGAGPGSVAEELLTEEIPLEIESVLTAEGAGALPAPRGKLDETVARPWAVPVALAGGGVLAALAGWLLVRGRRRARAEVRRSAAEVALSRLADLEHAGLPTDRAAADPWYVELSDIVRRYLEDRFGVRAPELTTEEFLREVRATAGFGDEHRALIAAFLEGCDRVKFAGHAPGEAESRAALDAATRLVRDTAVAPPAAPAAPTPAAPTEAAA